ELYRQRIDLDFAVRYHKGVVWEFGVLIDVWRDFPGPEIPSRRSFSERREGTRHPLPPIVHPAADVPADELAEAIAWHASPFKSSGTPVGAPPAPNGLPLVGHLVRRVRAVAREEGLAQVARRTVSYAGTRIRRATMSQQTVH